MLEYLFIIVFIIIILIVFFYRRVDYFDVKYQLVSGNQLTDDRFQIYNQNYSKKWKNPVEAYNYPVVTSYGSSYNDMYKMNQYIFNDFEKKDLDKFVKKHSKKVDGSEFLKDYTPFDLYNLNKKTWYNKYNWNPDYTLYQKYIKSDYEEINIINKLFLNMFNNYWFDFISGYVKRKVILYKPYFILKHRIVDILSSKDRLNNKPKRRIFEVVLVVTRDDGILGFEFYLKGLFIFNGKIYNLDKMQIDYIANYSLDKLLIRPNLNKDNLQFNLNPLWKNDTPLTSAQAAKIYKNEKKLINEEKNFLNYSYACFAYDKQSNDPISKPIFATDKNDCEDAYNIIGYKKPSGVWDRPCIEDKDCLFYKGNKNYDNTFGRCINGKCELPLNMKNLGYHYYIDTKSSKPLCYNCESDKWLPNTKLGFCCEEQKNNKKKYPFLKSPDYAFNNDSLARYNYFIQKNCRMKPKYDNIFKKTNVWQIDCDGLLDSYLVK